MEADRVRRFEESVARRRCTHRRSLEPFRANPLEARLGNERNETVQMRAKSVTSELCHAKTVLAEVSSWPDVWTTPQSALDS